MRIDPLCKMLHNIHQKQSVKNAIETDYDLTEIMLMDNNSKDVEDHEAPLILACKYQPESVKYIIESKYCTNELLMHKDKISGSPCSHYANDCQPLALLYLIQSDKIPQELLEVEYSNGYTIIGHFKEGNPGIGITTFENIDKKLPIITIKNEVAKIDDPFTCCICCTYTQKVKFEPCDHFTCVACAVKLKKCPVCRSHIQKKVEL